MPELENKTALVTGASRGIGRATAAALAEAGAHVLVHYGRSTQEAESLVAEIQTKGGRATAISADLGTPDGASLLAEQVRSIVGDRLDVLVLNAGISKAARIADYTIEDFDSLFATNVRGPFFLVQQLLPVLGEGSTIVVVSSLGARMVVGKPALENPSILAYASTKGALETLVKNWAAILGPRGIRVNAVAPGVIDTDLSNFTKTEAGREVALGMQALKRLGKPDDVADVVAFVASDAARWITGASIPVDGGSKLSSNVRIATETETSKGKEIKIPGPDHPITISRVEGKVRVAAAGRTVAESKRALRLDEKGYTPVYYLPCNDADMSLLVRTTHYTYCPYKGDCTYYSIPIGGAKSEYAVWTYEKPYEAVADIKEHLAFYPTRVDAIEVIS